MILQCLITWDSNNIGEKIAIYPQKVSLTDNVKETIMKTVSRLNQANIRSHIDWPGERIIIEKSYSLELLLNVISSFGNERILIDKILLSLIPKEISLFFEICSMRKFSKESLNVVKNILLRKNIIIIKKREILEETCLILSLFNNSNFLILDNKTMTDLDNLSDKTNIELSVKKIIVCNIFTLKMRKKLQKQIDLSRHNVIILSDKRLPEDVLKMSLLRFHKENI